MLMALYNNTSVAGGQHFYLYMSEEPDDFQSAGMTIVTASHCTLIGSSHGIPPIAFVVMTGSHHGNNNDDWQSAEKVFPAPLPRASTLRILLFREGSK